LYSDPTHPGVGLEALVYPGNLDIHRIDLQEEIGLDVIVHGEPERNDMVQYFAENLDGFAVTQNGWVQSYGSRCTRPSILWGDVSRPKPITVDWSRYAQSLTAKPVKGMLTGPVTILAWSFVRDDQPLGETARQVALALRDEIADLRPPDRAWRSSQTFGQAASTTALDRVFTTSTRPGCQVSPKSRDCWRRRSRRSSHARSGSTRTAV
jgi:hypothetical protein